MKVTFFMLFDMPCPVIEKCHFEVEPIFHDHLSVLWLKKLEKITLMAVVF
jgi:hypothetical protein